MATAHQPVFTVRTDLTAEEYSKQWKQVKRAEADLKAWGAKPIIDYRHGAPAPAASGGKSKPAEDEGEESQDPGWCSIHEVDMTKHKKDGQIWYSHKLPDGEWCRGKGKSKS